MDVDVERWTGYAKEGLRRHWDWLVVTALAVWMFIVRMRPYDAYRGDGAPVFIGTDPYYHARHVTYSVENFPRSLGYDALTQYPLGTDPGQFGTLFDQLGAALAWLVGLVVDGGQPSPDTVMSVFVAYPALLGALTVFAVYFVARQLTSRWPALFAAVVIAVVPGEFLIRSLAGYVDHHVMEALFSTLAVGMSIMAVRAWDATELTLEALVEDPRRLWQGPARRALVTSLGATLAFAAYLWTWPSGVLFIVLVAAWLLLETTLEMVRGREPAPLLLTGVATFLPLALVMVLHDRRSGFTAVNYSWMQPTMALLAALACLALGALVYLWRRRELPGWGFPSVAGGVTLAGVGAVYLFLPELWTHLLKGLSWVTGVGARETRLTIAEAKPAQWGDLYGEFGLLYLTAIAGFSLVAAHLVRRPRRTDSLMLLWAGLMTAATFTQLRFLYYLAIVVALLNGELAHHLLGLATELSEWARPGAGTKGARRRKGGAGATVGTNSVGTARAVVMVGLALTLVPLHVTGLSDQCRGDVAAYSLADCFGPGEEKLWQNQAVWLRDNSPPLPVSLATDFETPPRGERFAYPDGTYGVLSWWDYGHQIQFEAERPPIANPFQQQARLASEIFTAPGEGPAMDLLDEYLGPGNEARYLMIDDAMVSTKFGAITVWAEKDGQYWNGVPRTFQLPEGGTTQLMVASPEVRGWFLQDLFYNDGSDMDQWRLVQESFAYSYIGNRARLTDDGAQLRAYNTIIARTDHQGVLNDFGDLNFHSGREVLPAGRSNVAYDVRAVPALKIFERVQGATLTGTTDPGADVVATVDLEVQTTGRAIHYRTNVTAGPDGTFTLTVPYSTTDPLGPADGGTNTNVLATGPYRVSSAGRNATVDVPDRLVLEGGELAVAWDPLGATTPDGPVARST